MPYAQRAEGASGPCRCHVMVFASLEPGRLAMIELNVNGTVHAVDIDDAAPLLWVLREQLRLTGTKFACGISACGACTVNVDGGGVRSCQLPGGAARDRRVRTIEGLPLNRSHPLEKAWIAEQVPQCGYCQSGRLMSANALLLKHPRPTDRQIEDAMTNICRCGTYQRVRRAIRRAAANSFMRGGLGWACSFGR